MPNPFLSPSGGSLGSMLADPGAPPALRPAPMRPRRPPVDPGFGGPKPMFPPPAPRGPAGEVPPDSRNPTPSPTEGGLGAALGGGGAPPMAPPASPPVPPGGPPPVPMPRGPTQPDASGVVPPPNTPGYAPLPIPLPGAIGPAPGTAPAPGGPGRLGAAIRGATPPIGTLPPRNFQPIGAKDAGGLGALMAGSSAPPVTTAGAGTTGPQALQVADAPPGEEVPSLAGSGSTGPGTTQTEDAAPPPDTVTTTAEEASNSKDGGTKTKDGYQQAAQAAGFDVFDEGGNLTKLPIGDNGQIDPEFMAVIGFGNNPKMAEKMRSLADSFREWANADAGGNDNVARQAQTKILDALKDLNRNGLDLNAEGLFNYYTTGEGAGAFAPIQTQDPVGIDNGVVNEDGSVDLGGIDLDTAKAGLSDQFLDWLNKNPENGKAILDYLASLQSRDDRQTAIDAFQGGLGGLLENDPTRAAMYDYLGEGPHYTYDDATVEKMKMDGRQTYGAGVTNLDQQIREAAGARGLPTSDLAGLSVQGKMGLLNNLLNSERGVDITAAQQRQKDLQDYFSSLNAAQSSLLGPEAAYYGSLANLIAGTPGLAQTGNPLAGVAQFQLDSDLATQGPTMLDRIGAYAGIGGGIGSLLGGGAEILQGRK